VAAGAGYAPAGAHRATGQTADRFFRWDESALLESKNMRQHLTREDWDFETERLPECELRACYAHEYSRELAKRSARVANLLKSSWKGQLSPVKSSARYRGHLARERLLDLGISVTLLQADSVDLSWYSLPKNVRKGAIQHSVQVEKPAGPIAAH
jgi:hypothetical protein